VRPRLSADPERLKRVRTLFFSVALGLALFQLNVLLDSVIAYTLVAEGGVSTLYYANRLVQLPIGVLGVALSTAIFPALARLVKEGDLAGVGHVVDRGLSLGAFFAIPCAVGLVVLAEPIVQVLFERGRFGATSTARTSWVLLLLAPAVIAACVTPVVTRAFYAEEEVKTPVRVGVACVVLNLTLNLLLVGPMAEAGLALATSISQGVNLIAQTWLYRRRRKQRGDPPRTGETLRAVATYILLAALMGAVAFGVHRVVPGHAALRLAAAVIAGAVLYGALAWILRLEAPRLLLEKRQG
jgi:putative peptidoglycan lipid II flippase